MINADVVAYLQANIKQFPIEDLRRQLFEEGISEEDFDDSLKAAFGASKNNKLPPRALLKRLLLGAAAGLATLAAVAWLNSSAPHGDKNRAGPPESTSPGANGAFVGYSGYVVRLPKNYTAVSQFLNNAKTDEMVHFCKIGTDPTLFLNEGLYGALGIIALEVTTSPFPQNEAGVASLAAAVTNRAQNRGLKFSAKNISVSTLPGVQLNIESPDPRLEVYVLGKKSLYSFSTGPENDLSREIIMSLRDTQSEN